MADQTRKRRPRQQRRATIVDVARASGVSLSAASYALNGKPGVSEATRALVVRTAEQLGWVPSHTARALQGQRTRVVGLVFAVDGPAQRSLSDYMMRFVNGINTELAADDRAMLVTTVDSAESELEVYRSWASQRRVDGFVITNVRRDDARLDLVQKLEIPAVIAGDVRGHSPVPSVWTDDAAAMTMTLDHLLSKGHRRIVRFSDNPHYLHAEQRAAAFEDYLAEHGLRADGNLTAAPNRVETTAQLRVLLAEPDPPTALICDSADRACQTLLALKDLGRPVPEDLALVVWDDAPVCEITTPTLTAVARDAFDYGAAVARQLVAQLSGTAAGDCQGIVSELIVRESS
ncbi:LacI family DNA-binding transcriptional regulator [Microlunatus elymi]|uniref:LacI family DNA-binding transcriptional regulator n=1 Tax=Microlunatus elymi TaxID=2596828 RepID=UPI00143D604A|nr:LacI family DNA-binding transcriptional regulator [Microlunatus elymi]